MRSLILILLLGISQLVCSQSMSPAQLMDFYKTGKLDGTWVRKEDTLKGVGNSHVVIYQRKYDNTEYIFRIILDSIEGDVSVDTTVYYDFKSSKAKILAWNEGLAAYSPVVKRSSLLEDEREIHEYAWQTQPGLAFEVVARPSQNGLISIYKDLHNSTPGEIYTYHLSELTIIYTLLIKRAMEPKIKMEKG